MSAGDSPLSEVELVAFDLETTGLFPAACRIVEFGAVRFKLHEGELDHFEQLVDPECPIPRAAVRIHGITDAMVRGMPTVPQTLPKFLRFLGGPQTILLAHNAPFDLGFLGFAMTRLAMQFPSNPVIDTLDLSRSYVWELYSHRLEDVARHLRVAESEDHRALSDARLLTAVFQKILGRGTRLKTAGDLFRVSPPLGFEDSGVCDLDPPKGYEELEAAIEEERTVVVVYEGGTKGLVERRITPRALLQSRGRAYLAAYCHTDGVEKTYRLDRIRELRVEPE